MREGSGEKNREWKRKVRGGEREKRNTVINYYYGKILEANFSGYLIRFKIREIITGEHKPTTVVVI